MDKSGDEGWELVTTRTDTGSCYQYLLKRLKPANAPKYVDPQAAPPKKENAPACKLTAAQAPTIRGLRLGMTVDELLELFPGANPSDLKGKVEQAKSYPSFGRSEYSFPGTQHKDRLESLSFHVGLFDGRVSHFQIYYKFNNRTEPELIYNREQLIEKLSASFMLPSDAKWQEVGYAELRLVCQGFTLQVNSRSQGFVVLPRRGVVERTFAWLSFQRQMSKNYEYLPAVSETFIRIVMISLVLLRVPFKTRSKQS